MGNVSTRKDGHRSVLCAGHSQTGGEEVERGNGSPQTAIVQV